MALLSRRASTAGNVDLRSPPSSAPPTAHKPSRKASFLSLRKEKSSNLDNFPSSNPSRLNSPKSSGRLSSSSSVSPSLGDPSPIDSDFTILHESTLVPRIYYRNRSNAAQDKRRPATRVSIPDFRHSVSTQRTDTPPHTPTDILSSPQDSAQDFSVLVAAPLGSGVETIDALVDGMNGGDILSQHSIGFSSRTTKSHHPLYRPPLPTPPPGVVLGGGISRRSKRGSKPTPPPQSSDEDDFLPSNPRPRRKRRKRPSTSNASPSDILHDTPKYTNSPSHPIPSSDEEDRKRPATSNANPPARLRDPPKYASSPSRRVPSDEESPLTPMPISREHPKSTVPSISEIIRAHAPPNAQRSHSSSLKRSPSHSASPVHPTLREESEKNPRLSHRDTNPVSRSSVDSVAEEVQRSLRLMSSLQPIAPKPKIHSSPHKRLSVLSLDSNSVKSSSLKSPRSDRGSIYSGTGNFPLHTPDGMDVLDCLKPSQNQEVARYLRSARLTTLLRLTRFPHASPESPLTVSLSDMGNPTGFPVVVFLGLGCVRHIMGLYDEMADCLNLRLITIDRWGLGRTEQRPKSEKGILQWTSVVDEVLDLLQIQQCSIMAHSAGAPYALAFASRFPDRIRGNLFLLAPWVGGSDNGGYKWLKYVPNGILKTAQAAEWKVQTWMLGKPPSLAYEGIGYTKDKRTKSTTFPRPNEKLSAIYPHLSDNKSRPSIGSSFSEYDDLQDFDGRFESKSTLGRSPPVVRTGSESKLANKRKVSLGLFERFKPSVTSPPQSPERAQPPRKLKALRSMGSLQGRAAPSRKSPEIHSPQLPPPIKIEVGLGLDDIKWSQKSSSGLCIQEDPRFGENEPTLSASHSAFDRRRSLSLSTSQRPTLSLPSSPAPSTYQSSFVVTGTPDTSTSFQAALGNALISASHFESSKGTHSDLLQILNHDNQPWGFSYADYPHQVRVWYGDKDEKIAEHAVRWMERTMGTHRCTVQVVPGADHGLMFKSGVVVDVLEAIASFWRGPI